MKKALFLDRDGVINEDSGYIHKVEDVHFVDGIFDLCQKATELGYLIIVVSNQSGVGKGYYSEDDVLYLHNWMSAKFMKHNILMTEFYYSTYHPDAIDPAHLKNSHHRKPKPGMIIKALEKYEIDIHHSIMVGDKESDRIKIDGLKSYIVKSKYCSKNYDVKSISEITKLLS
jgi:D-glycero-D-manno-heptose 1,7-bisphosphate phosphatase